MVARKASWELELNATLKQSLSQCQIDMPPLYFQLGGIPVPWIPWQPVPAGEGRLQALQWVRCPPSSVPVREAYPWHAVAPTGLLHHGQQVRLREGEKEKEWKWGRGAEEEGKGERCLRPYLSNTGKGRVRIYNWSRQHLILRNSWTTLHSSSSLFFSFSPVGWALLSPPFSLFLVPNFIPLHSPPGLKRGNKTPLAVLHKILGSGYDASWETESLELPAPSSCPCALHTLSAVQNPGQVFNKKENLDFKHVVIVIYSWEITRIKMFTNTSSKIKIIRGIHIWVWIFFKKKEVNLNKHQHCSSESHYCGCWLYKITFCFTNKYKQGLYNTA